MKRGLSAKTFSERKLHHQKRFVLSSLLLAVLSLIGWGVKAGGREARPATEPLSAFAPAATIFVNSAEDGPPTTNGKCTLREAIINANSNNQSGSTDCQAGSGADIINFSLPALHHTINLTGVLPDLVDSVSIVNSIGPAKLTVRRDSGGLYRIFNVPTKNLNITITGLTISEGHSTGYDGGGGIYSRSPLHLTNCIVSNNSAEYGGGISLEANGLFTGCAIINNTAAEDGGGIDFSAFIGESATLTLVNVTISGNVITDYGGSGITAGTVVAASKLELINCTIVNNTSSYSFSSGTIATLGDDTMTVLRNTILANNALPNLGNGFPFSPTILSEGGNLADDGGSGFLVHLTDQINKNPILADLGQYGGQTPTHALLPGSPAINGGISTNAPVADQRGVTRVGLPDIGAFESRGFNLAAIFGNNQSVFIGNGFPDPLLVQVTSAFNEPVAGGKVSFVPPPSGATATLTPSVATINASNRASTMAAANNQAGSYQVEASANGNLVNFNLTNLACPGINISPAFPVLPAGTVGQPYNVAFTQTGGQGSILWNVSGTLPGNLALNHATGVLSGVLADAGAFNFTVTATDSNGCFGTRSYALTVYGIGAAANNLQFYPLPHPVRLLDTRAGFAGCDAPGAKIPGNTSRHQTAAGRTCDGLTIPERAVALVGNATSVQSGGGYFTLYPSDIAKPNSANSNYAANQILNGLFTVRLGDNDGAFKIFVSTDTDIVVDITGYYAPPLATGLYFHPLPKPVRLLDTRPVASACFTPGAALQGDTVRTQLGTTTCDSVLIPAGAQALVGNATTVSPQANGFLTLYPADATRPLIASANFQPGVNLNSPFVVGLSPSGEFNIYVASTTDLVVDVTGYYSTQLNDSNGQGLLFNALAAPTRLLDTRTGQTGCFTPGAPMTGGTPYTQPATGVCSNVPSAQAVVGNVTTVNATANGYLTFWPSGANQPFIATSNYRTGIPFNRHFTVGLGADGAFKRYAASTTDLVIDLVGYFAP